MQLCVQSCVQSLCTKLGTKLCKKFVYNVGVQCWRATLACNVGMQRWRATFVYNVCIQRLCTNFDPNLTLLSQPLWGFSPLVKLLGIDPLLFHNFKLLNSTSSHIVLQC